LDVYRTPIDSDFEVIAKYLWNMVLCEALYPALHTLEIALRNTVRQAAIGRYHNEHWFEPPTSPLDPRGQASVATAKSELTKVGKALEPDRIVSELTFGFWVNLLHRRYEPALWPRMLPFAFPNMPQTIRNPRFLTIRFHEIRALRNRVFHHERISDCSDLALWHDDILQALDWINPGLRQMLASIDRFQHTYKRGLETVRAKLGDAVDPSVNAYAI
jgi:hypothetical protein